MPGIVVGTFRQGATRFGGFGTLADTGDPGGLTWEIGSITKVFTGTLLAEMALRGEVSLDDPITRWVPGDVAARLPTDPPLLRDLATHTAGLPRIPRIWLRRMKGSDDPYAGLDEADVWDVLGPETRRPHKARVRYSNYGMGLLGHLLAAAAGSDYPTLVQQRILGPLGLGATEFDGPTPVPGFRRRRPTPPWAFGALHGAGALRSTAADLLRFAAAVIEPPPGTLGDALRLAAEPAHRGRVIGVGLGWQHRIVAPGRDTTPAVWHDGGTYATQSFLAADLAGARAVVVFGNRGPVLRVPVATAGWRILDER